MIGQTDWSWCFGCRSIAFRTHRSKDVVLGSSTEYSESCIWLPVRCMEADLRLRTMFSKKLYFLFRCVSSISSFFLLSASSSFIWRSSSSAGFLQDVEVCFGSDEVIFVWFSRGLGVKSDVPGCSGGFPGTRDCPDG